MYKTHTKKKITETKILHSCDKRNISDNGGERRVDIYDIIYLLTAIELSPGGSTHLHTDTT
jgi:hypothetical protein